MRAHRAAPAGGARAAAAAGAAPLPRGQVGLAIAMLVALLFSKNVYTASLSSYYTFYLIDKFDALGADGAVLPRSPSWPRWWWAR